VDRGEHVVRCSHEELEGPDGDLAATTTTSGGTVLHLSTVHGDTPIQLPLDDPDQVTVVDTDEYGNPTTGTPTRYAWLGAKQRSTGLPPSWGPNPLDSGGAVPRGTVRSGQNCPDHAAPAVPASCL